jgi:hypothetical protein
VKGIDQLAVNLAGYIQFKDGAVSVNEFPLYELMPIEKGFPKGSCAIGDRIARKGAFRLRELCAAIWGLLGDIVQYF